MKFRLLLLLAALLPVPALADDWPQFLGPKRDGIWREVGILEKFPEGGPKKLWSAKLGGGYGGPSVAGGKVFVADYTKGDSGGTERIVCFDAAKGTELWATAYPVTYKIPGGYTSGPRCTPLVEGEFVYTVGAMGDLTCLAVADGKKVWSKNYVSDYKARVPLWGFASHPVIEGDKLICVTGGSGDNFVIAFDKATGKELWHSQELNADCGYAAVMIYEFDKVRTAVVWHQKAIIGLDPATGKRLWKYDFEIKFGLTAPTPRQVGTDKLFATAFYDGPVLLKIGAEKPEVIWKGTSSIELEGRTDKLHSIMTTPFVKDGHIYGVCSYGELRCLKSDTGERVWSTRQPIVGTKTDAGKPTRWGNAFLVEHADRFFIFNEQGELVIAKLTPKGCEEIDRAAIIKPTNKDAGRKVVWVYPAYAGKKMYVRNDEEIVCVDLAR
jgi:outer membrane protein assembly factor BamB